MQIPRFTSSKPSEFAFASDEKSIRRPTASFVRCHLKNRRAGNPARRSRLSKTHGELERAEALSIINRARRRVRRVREDFCGGKSHFQSKNRFLADFAPGDFEEILAKSGRGGDPGGIRTHGLSLRRTRVVLFVHLVSFDFPSFHLDLPRNSASFPKRQTGLIVGFVWLFRTPLLAEFQLFPIPRKPAIPSLPQGKEMQSRKERLALLCPAAFFCT